MAESTTTRLTVIGQPDKTAMGEFIALFDDDPSVTVDGVRTETPDEVADAVAAALTRGVDCIASVGGDGSNNLVVSALLDSGSDVTFAPVPAGTVNLVAHVLGVDDAEMSADAVRTGRVRTIDVGETEQGIFVLNASTGFDAAVIGDADDHSDARFGRLSFLRAGLRRLRRESGEHVRVEVDDEVVFDGRAMSVIVMNFGQRGSESLSVAPDAEPDDGVLDVAIVRVETIRRMVATAARLVLRRDVPDRDAVRAQGARISIEWAAAVPSQRDGDAVDPARSLTAKCRPQVLTIHHG